MNACALILSFQIFRLNRLNQTFRPNIRHELNKLGDRLRFGALYFCLGISPSAVYNHTDCILPINAFNVLTISFTMLHSLSYSVVF